MARPGTLQRKIAIPLVAVLAAIGVVALIGPAAADTPSDGRAQFFGGNATECADVGFPNSIQTEGDSHVDATVSDHNPEGEELNVTIDAGFTLDAIVVKGGNGYNVYSSAVADMIPPLNGGGNIPAISHFFVCYHEGVPDTTTTTTTTVTTAAAPTTAAAGAAVSPQTVAVQPRFTG